MTGSDTVYDLGCGDGRIVIAAAQRYGARGVGIDLNPARIEEARVNARDAGVDNRISFEAKDLFDVDFRSATVVALYLLPDVNLRLRSRLLSELSQARAVVSHAFGMGDWKPARRSSLRASTSTCGRFLNTNKFTSFDNCLHHGILKFIAHRAD